MAREIKGTTVIDGAFKYVFSTVEEAEDFLVCLEDGGTAMQCAMKFKPLRVEPISPPSNEASFEM
ncbi:hypothetical protein CF68_33285 [Cupriavidus sp. SK-4]|uniref:hypothetical protein n=1 Tax=Cupriavidus sp. SK-4 TaxID=574750 RepID=UPI0004515274|nr:hypothetical protein [Cupriavidus sp. SK-4]EYS89549.1 hypothetical protein CF68_33285 [Cupriavidus sp. SK-4]